MLTKATVGGVTNHIIDLGEKIEAIDLESKIYIGCDENEATNSLQQHFQTFILDFFSKNPIKIIKTYNRLKKIIIDNNIDMIHCHYRIPAIYVKLLSNSTKIKYVWTNHLAPIPYDFFHRKTTFYGEKAIAISKESQKFIVEKLRIPYEKTQIIYHGINLDNFDYNNRNQAYREKLGIDNDSKVIVLLGRLEAVKGHRFLLDSVRNMDNIILVFTGSGNEEYKKELKSYIDKIGCQDKVVFTGFVKPEEILGIADVMVLPSVIEGFSISSIESFAMKVPVIRTKTAGYEDMKDLCLGVDYGDTGMLRRAIEKAIDRNEMRPMIERAYLKVLKEWNIDTMAKKYLELYKGAKSNG